MSAKKRLKEPSTYAGLAAVIAGLGQIFSYAQADQVATVVKAAGNSISTGDYVTAGGTILLGLAAIFVKEKGAQ